MITKWLLYFVLIHLFSPQIVCSTDLFFPGTKPQKIHATETPELVEEAPAQIPKNPYDKFNHLRHVAYFDNKDDAERFAEKLENEGFDVAICKGILNDKKTIYTIFAEKSKEPSKVAAASGEVKQKTPLQTIFGEIEPVEKKLCWEPEELSKVIEASGREKEIATLKILISEENVKEIVGKFENEGFNVLTRRDVWGYKKTIYKGFEEKNKELVNEVIVSTEVKKDISSKSPSDEEKPVVEEKLKREPEEPSRTTADSEEVRQFIPSETASTEDQPVVEERQQAEPKKPMDPTIVEVAQETTSEEPFLGEKPSEKERITADIFGKRNSYLHPFLSITGYYTDNVFNTSEKKQSDFVTILSPGIWLTVPHIREKLVSLDTSSISPGGFSLSRYPDNYFRRYQAYLFYGADIELFSEYSSENVVSHKFEGLFQYNFRGGLTIDLVDQFLVSHDIRGTGISTELDKFNTNLFNVILTYDVSRKFRFRIDYANFLVNYDASTNDFRDRIDNAFSGYVFYKFRPKTSIFLEYEFIDINYDEDVLSNGKEHHYFGGLQWDITAKTKGSVKAGYGVKDFNSSIIEDSKDFILEAQIDYKLSPKTSLKVSASRKTNETNISTTDFILSNSIEVGYVHRLTGKITGSANLSYTKDTYKDELTFGGETKERKDNYFTGGLAFQYIFREWLGTSLGYVYTKRDSNFADFNYNSNIVFFRITASL
jgi:hypothetical protein